MFKKIIIFSVMIFVIGITSCSMWDDVDKNAMFEIPVADINVVNWGVPNAVQWANIPYLYKNDPIIIPATLQEIVLTKIATNSDKTRLYFYIEVNNTIFTSGYMIVLSNDYSCSGHKFYINYMGSPGNVTVYKMDVCSTNMLPTSSTISEVGYNKFETSTNISQSGLVLNDIFLVSVYSFNNVLPYLPVYSTPARWVKLR